MKQNDKIMALVIIAVAVVIIGTFWQPPKLIKGVPEFVFSDENASKTPLNDNLCFISISGGVTNTGGSVENVRLQTQIKELGIVIATELVYIGKMETDDKKFFNTSFEVEKGCLDIDGIHLSIESFE